MDCSTDAVVGQRCPECSKQIGTTRVQRMATMSPLDGAPLTRGIIGVTAVIFVMSWLSGSLDDALFHRLAYYGPLAAEGELWRMVSVTLLHAGLWHIGFNMYALYIFGPAIERSLGRGLFAALYVGSAAFGSLAVYLLADPATIGVGASGAIFGLLGMWVYRAYRVRDTRMGRAQLRQYGLIIGLNAVIPLFVRNVAWEAHVGGFLGGVLLAVVVSRVANRKIATLIVALLGAAAVAVPLIYTPF